MRLWLGGASLKIMVIGAKSENANASIFITHHPMILPIKEDQGAAGNRFTTFACIWGTSSGCCGCCDGAGCKTPWQ